MKNRTFDLTNLRIFLRHNRSFVFFTAVSFISLFIGAAGFSISQTPVSLFGASAGDFVGVFLPMLEVTLAFVAVNLLSSVFLLGPATVTAASALIFIGIGYSGSSAAYLYGFRGIFANAVCTAIPTAAVFVLFTLFSAKTVRISAMLGSAVCGRQTAGGFKESFRAYLILLSVMSLVCLAVSAAAAVLTVFMQKML